MILKKAHTFRVNSFSDRRGLEAWFTSRKGWSGSIL